MTIGKIQAYGLIVVCAVLIPFLLDLCLALLPFVKPAPPGISYTLVCLGLLVVIVGILATICIRLAPSFNAANALLFTFAALVVMRIDHLLSERPQFVELNEAVALIFACLLVFGSYLFWRGRANRK
ncbi:MAG: hypothetical protein OXG08_07075 [Gammaproteobacteria bacterium]|nr:hypothetical protein [Gammaproteobacteria bacterium]